MRRFLLCSILLALTLLFARAADSTASGRSDSDLGDDDYSSWHGHADFDLHGEEEEILPFFDHDVVPRTETSRSKPSTRRRDEDRPRVHEGIIRLRYRDRGYDRVLLESDDRDWQPVEMQLDDEGSGWEIELAVPEEELRYRFVVQYDDGRERFRVDPSHSGRERVEDLGWVSVLRFDRSGRIVVRDVERRHPERRRRDDYDLDLFRELELDYQRVDGFLLSTRPRFSSKSQWAPTLASKIGYGLKSDRWSGGVYFLQPLTPSGEFRAVVSAYDQTDFTDRTGVGGLENLFSTLLFREDNREHYRREGASIGLEAQLRDWLLGRLEFRWDEYESLDRVVRAGWWGREDFLPNRAIDEGRMRSLYMRARFGTPLNHFFVGYELSDPSFSSDFDFQQLQLRYRTRLRMGYSHHLDLRVEWGGNLSGELPLQKRYLLGGIGTVRGYNYQSLLEGTAADPESYGGEQMFLATAEYVLGVDDSVQLALFSDAGMAYVDRKADLDPSRWKSSAGIGVIFGDSEGVRLDLIRTLDGGNDDFMLQGRLDRAF
jgi:Omp85 superfamily domain